MGSKLQNNGVVIHHVSTLHCPFKSCCRTVCQCHSLWKAVAKSVIIPGETLWRDKRKGRGMHILHKPAAILGKLEAFTQKSATNTIPEFSAKVSYHWLFRCILVKTLKFNNSLLLDYAFRYIFMNIQEYFLTVLSRKNVHNEIGTLSVKTILILKRKVVLQA